MQSNESSPDRTFKLAAYTAWADVTKALGSYRRLELLELLLQRPHRVDELVARTGRPLPTISQHLGVLRRAGLVLTQRRGTAIHYRPAPGVAEAVVAVRRLALGRSSALQEAVEHYYADAPETIPGPELQDLLAAGRATLVDVRPNDEYVEAHIPGAVSIPLPELLDRVDELPDGLLVATCRGPFCTYAATAVRVLREAGREAVRFEQGPADWAYDGGVLA